MRWGCGVRVAAVLCWVGDQSPQAGTYAPCAVPTTLAPFPPFPPFSRSQKLLNLPLLHYLFQLVSYRSSPPSTAT